MRVILDTNILASALISETGPPFKIYELWVKQRFDLLSSTDQIEEIRQISRYPKFRSIVARHYFGRLINALKDSEQVDVAPVSIELNDPTDLFLLGMAKAGDADYLVTGDKRAGLLALGSYGRTRIVTPGVFVAEVLG
jgi:uncharacterized protein